MMTSPGFSSTRGPTRPSRIQTAKRPPSARADMAVNNWLLSSSATKAGRHEPTFDSLRVSLPRAVTSARLDHFQATHCAGAWREVVGFDAEAVEDVDEDVGQRVIALAVEGELGLQHGAVKAFIA